jgi:large subunit ribosomal protein L23
MKFKHPYQVVKHPIVTEKSKMLLDLTALKSNPSLAAYENVKYVFEVDLKANKQQIAEAIEEIYKEREVKVLSVNTIIVKPKPRRMRGRVGKKPAYKKAIVTLGAKDTLITV